MRRLFLLAIVLVTLALAAAEPNPTARQRELIDKLMAVTDDGTTVQSMVDMIFSTIEKESLDRAAANGNSAEAIAESKELYETFRKAAKVDFNALLHESTVRTYAGSLPISRSGTATVSKTTSSSPATNSFSSLCRRSRRIEPPNLAPRALCM